MNTLPAPLRAAIILAASFCTSWCDICHAETTFPGCGEICIRLLCEYYHVSFDEDQVRKLLEPGPSGETTVARMGDALEALGFDSRAVKGSVDQLRREKSPVIIFAKQSRADAIGHFAVVMWDSSNERPIVIDPLTRAEPFVVTADDFGKVWSGVAILAKPRGSVSWPKIYTYLLVGFVTLIAGVLVGKRTSTKRSPG
jgi:ABC-type bacteriocin/lantibiotic exporter with double-glycine peptidase domain